MKTCLHLVDGYMQEVDDKDALLNVLLVQHANRTGCRSYSACNNADTAHLL